MELHPQIRSTTFDIILDTELEFQQAHIVEKLQNNPRLKLSRYQVQQSLKLKTNIKCMFDCSWAVTSDRAVCHSTQRTRVQTLPEEITTTSILSNPVSHKGASLLWTRFEPGTIPPETPGRGKLECDSDQLIWTSLAISSNNCIKLGMIKCLDYTESRDSTFRLNTTPARGSAPWTPPEAAAPDPTVRGYRAPNPVLPTKKSAMSSNLSQRIRPELGISQRRDGAEKKDNDIQS
ncbi:hypothetical protein LXL04_018292 [Taraxacum kok-saghyz]